MCHIMNVQNTAKFPINCRKCAGNFALSCVKSRRFLRRITIFLELLVQTVPTISKWSKVLQYNTQFVQSSGSVYGFHKFPLISVTYPCALGCCSVPFSFLKHITFYSWFFPCYIHLINICLKIGISSLLSQKKQAHRHSSLLSQDNRGSVPFYQASDFNGLTTHPLRGYLACEWMLFGKKKVFDQKQKFARMPQWWCDVTTVNSYNIQLFMRFFPVLKCHGSKLINKRYIMLKELNNSAIGWWRTTYLIWKSQMPNQ